MTPAMRTALAWGVHFYTALGLACAAGMAVLVVEGEPASYRGAFWLMLLATLVDATDGTFARMIHVKEVLPGFDGRRLDDLIDFLTFTVLPLLLIWRANLLPAGTEGLLLVPLFASAYGFCQVEAKTADGYFLGFPSYWNLVAFYLYALQPMPGSVSLAIVLVLAVLTFVPARYLYPSQKGRLNLWTNVLAVPWTILLAVALWLLPGEEARMVAMGSLYYPIYYFVVSWIISIRYWARKATGRRGPGGSHPSSPAPPAPCQQGQPG